MLISNNNVAYIRNNFYLSSSKTWIIKLSYKVQKVKSNNGTQDFFPNVY